MAAIRAYENAQSKYKNPLSVPPLFQKPGSVIVEIV